MLNLRDKMKEQKPSLDFGEELSDEASSKVVGGSVISPISGDLDQNGLIIDEPENTQIFPPLLFLF